MGFNLRDYQKKGKNDIEHFLEESPYKKGIFVQPVGTGKSLGCALISELSGADTLVIQPREELLTQNIEKARALGLDPSIYSAALKSKQISKLTYATNMSVVNRAEDFKGFKTVIIDEAHIGMTNTLQGGQVNDIGKLNEFLNHIQPDKVIGLTATPIQLTSSRNGAELKMVNRSKRSYWYQCDIFHVTQIHEIKDDYWANIEYETYEVSTGMLKLNTTGTEFKDETLIAAYEQNNTEEKIFETYYNLIKEGKQSILIFVPSVEKAESLCKNNREFHMVSANTPKEERRQLIQAFKNKEIPCLVSVETLTTGFDAPNTDGLILARETNSLSLFYQMCGRLVRPLVLLDGSVFRPTKKLVDLTNNCQRFGVIDNITFEKQDYTKGWAMWNNNRIMTGYPLGNWEMPTRESIKGIYDKATQQQIKQIKKEDVRFHWGKYKNFKVSDVLKKDKGYLKWLVTAKPTADRPFDWKGEKNQKLLKAIQEELDKTLITTD